MKAAGDRTFPDWTVTIQNDEDFLLRSTFEAWSNYINAMVGNVRNPNFLSESGGPTPGIGTNTTTTTGGSSGTSYKVEMDVTQFSKTGSQIVTYAIMGAWPNNVAEIRLGWDQTNQIEVFDVTFSYDWWEISNTTAAITVDPTGGQS
jgi:hypothetical protein